jgi:hypothetical protein
LRLADAARDFGHWRGLRLFRELARRFLDRERQGREQARRLLREKGHERRQEQHSRHPPGWVSSPLLSVIYMNRFLKHWRLTGRGEVLHAHVVSYADDFVILSRGHAEEVLTWTRAVMTKLGLTLSERKPR